MKSIIGALNDKQRFNKQEVVSILQSVVDNQEEMTDSDLRSQLEGFSRTRSNTSTGETADELVSHIDNADMDKYRKYHNEIRNQGVNVVTVADDKYPDKLKFISNPPLAIYVNGTSLCPAGGITVIGTRSATEQRIEAAERIAKKITDELNVPVISGLANGIDEAAHRSAVDSNGETIAVLPSDVEDVKPVSNSELADSICSHGALLSEVSNMVGFHKGRYLERNRITSGLSDAVVVVASKQDGGTMKQAILAEEQDKPRFIYQAPQSDGQTPDVLVEKRGYKKFTSADGLIRQVRNSNEKNTDHQGNLTLGNY